MPSLRNTLSKAFENRQGKPGNLDAARFFKVLWEYLKIRKQKQKFNYSFSQFLHREALFVK
jgi:hypothetical protein